MVTTAWYLCYKLNDLFASDDFVTLIKVLTIGFMVTHWTNKHEYAISCKGRRLSLSKYWCKVNIYFKITGITNLEYYGKGFP